MEKNLILSRLSDAVLGTEKLYYTQEELALFAGTFENVFSENADKNAIADTFVDWACSIYSGDRESPLYVEECRRCSECGKLIKCGYSIENGSPYYCSNECLNKHFSDDSECDWYNWGDNETYWK